MPQEITLRLTQNASCEWLQIHSMSHFVTQRNFSQELQNGNPDGEKRHCAIFSVSQWRIWHFFSKASIPIFQFTLIFALFVSLSRNIYILFLSPESFSVWQKGKIHTWDTFQFPSASTTYVNCFIGRGQGVNNPKEEVERVEVCIGLSIWLAQISIIQ